VRWAGNEDGYASLDNPLTVSHTIFSELDQREHSCGRDVLMPAECDAMMRSTWFFDHNENTLKSLDVLYGMYESSVGRGSNFLINIGPDNRGLLPECDARRLIELGDRIRENFSNPVSFTAPEDDEGELIIRHTEAKEGDWLMPSDTKLVNSLVIEEDITEGDKVRGFEVYAYLPRYSKRRVLHYVGKTVGHKLIVRFPTVQASAISLKITDAEPGARIKDMRAYYVK
jgi:alpha-L-fucosidase